MPQPFSRIVRDATIYLDANILHDKPEMASLVTQIFGTWAAIEHELSLLLARVLGAEESPALAMYGVLNSQHLQMLALEAAAKAALPIENYQVFQALISACDSAQKPRNHLAHWLWGGCRERSDLLALADPLMVRERDMRVAKYYGTHKKMPEDMERFLSLHNFDSRRVLAYSKMDLERALRDLKGAANSLLYFEFFLDPKRLRTPFSSYVADEDPASLREELLRRLNEERLFREALDRICADQKSIHPTPDESPEPEPGEL